MVQVNLTDFDDEYTVIPVIDPLDPNPPAPVEVFGRKGNDSIVGSNVGDILRGEDGGDFLVGISGIDSLYGDAGDDVLDGGLDRDFLFGGIGNDVLDGGLENDVMEGGLGNDVYFVSATNDTVVELLSQGIDAVYTSATYTLSVNVENLFAQGAGAINLTGNALANSIVGNDSANTIDGGVGADRMEGKRGNDIYIVDHVGDIVVELVGQGTDTVRAAVNYTLVANVENLELLGTAALRGTGNALANRMTGNAGGNALDGGLGADILAGGGGNDIYTVDNVSDLIVEALGEGNDTVNATVTYALAANVENLNLNGSAAINGTGNGLVNRIVGNAAANVLNGGNGPDTLIGGLGADTYFVETSGDVVIETGADVDSIVAFSSYVLPAFVENLTLSGFATSATGNTLNNRLIGTSFGNRLDGMAGADEMRGGDGNDTYYVDNIGDVVVELAGQGVDIVVSAISYTLGLNVENLDLAGALAINGTGNALKNDLRGNAAANILNGGLNADAMAGAGGNDTYIVDNAGDILAEGVNQGIDTVNASVSFVLGPNIENLTLTGASAIRGTGNDLANKILGNGAANTIDGKQGANTLTGGLGKDVFVFSAIDAVNTITDFKSIDDTIRLSDAAFGGALTPGGAVTLISGVAPVSGAAVPTFLYNTGTGRLSFDGDGTGAVDTPVLFLILTNKPVLTTADFQVVA